MLSYDHQRIVIDPFDHVNIHCTLCGEHRSDPCVVEGGKRGVTCVRNSFLIPVERILRNQLAKKCPVGQEAQSILWSIFVSISP